MWELALIHLHLFCLPGERVGFVFSIPRYGWIES